MAYFPSYRVIITLAILLVSLSSSSAKKQELSSHFYKHSCPELFSTVKCAVRNAIKNETRMGASLLRLHFHDCFVNGCDASILLDDVTGSITGEKTAGPNNNSARGFDTIDTIKSAVEKVCPATVSCADILAIVARDSVVQLGGPTWEVKLGRRDSLNASLAAANNGSIPAPTSSLANLTARFNQLGLSNRDLVALSGAHTIGQARCTSFRNRIYNDTNRIYNDTNINSIFAAQRQANCPSASGLGDNNLAPLDRITPRRFYNHYFNNLVSKNGLLHSDQELFNGG
ncbi:peroxidase 4 [Phtheirospermum japonicum]|uniref:Peroxidase n=1 Tax=Phtheirospermum japonicum TaxID=374723 RepID=A0A830CWM3_9LAMI|nr:peroxidase 4 [Phtheirospermum japonicum]